MGKKNKGPVPCDACDHSFASIPHLQQHVRDKHRNSLKQAPSAQAQPPVAQEPRVQTQNEPAHTVRPTSYSERALTGLTCEYCLTRFMTSYTLDQHKAMFHSWKCTKCPALPPFQHELAWQMHLNAVHATAGAKGKGAVTPANKGKMNDQRSGANHDTNTKAQSVVTQPEPSPSSLPTVQNPVISNPPSVVLKSSVKQGKIASPPSDDKSGFSTSKAKSQPVHHTNLEVKTASFDERDLLSPSGPTLNLLVEIDPKPRRSRDEVTYEIASDAWSPAITVSSLGADEPEEDYDTDERPLLSSRLRNGRSPRKGGDITDPPRVPKLGEREGRTLSAIVTRDHSRDEPKVQRQNGLVGATPSPANLERYGEVRSGSPASTSFSSRDEGRNTNRGDLSHDDDPQRTHRSKRSKLGSPEVHFECRICLSDPTPATNLTATLCGHLFCYECIAPVVLEESRCPVCKNVLALYCLFKLDLAS